MGFHKVHNIVQAVSRKFPNRGLTSPLSTREPSGLNLGRIMYIYTFRLVDNKGKNVTVMVIKRKIDISLLFHCHYAIFST